MRRSATRSTCKPGTIGDDVALTIDANWQYAAETALAQGIASARDQQNANIKSKRFEKLKAPGGAVLAIDVTDGSIVAMASFPNYDVSSFVDGISQTEWKALNDNPDHPLVNRATQGVYAPGSTFKLVSSIAMTQYGIRGPNDTVLDKGTVTLGKDKRDFHNAGNAALGRVQLQSAITRSSDVYFYTAGDAFWQAWNNGDKERGLGLQTTAHEFGFGAPTGVELDEAAGTVPDPEWKQALADKIWPTAAQKKENGAWYPADDIFTAVGQGGMAVTPLQLANAYAAFANGGTLWKPHVELDVKDTNGNVVQTYAPQAIRQIPMDANVRAKMLAGLRRCHRGSRREPRTPRGRASTSARSRCRARPAPRRSARRKRARVTRRCSPGSSPRTRPATWSWRSSNRAAWARRPRRPSCGASSSR